MWLWWLWLWLWFFVLLGIRPRAQAFCPPNCYCEEAHPTVKCESAHLGVVPILLNPNLKRLNLAHNTIKSINEVLGYYEQLEVLNLSRNSLFSIGNENFKVQKKLKVLNLSFNNLTQLDSNAFHGLRVLSRLDLSHNFISNISYGALSSTPNLRDLVLAKNRLHALHSTSLKGLQSLRILNLCDNYFREVPGEALRQLKNLEELLLCRNRLTYLRRQELTNPKLKVLSLLSNRISSVDSQAMYHLSHLKSLNLNDNGLEEIPTASFQYLENLQTLDVGRNKLTTLRSRVFEGLKTLVHLEISRCPSLQNVEPFPFKGPDNLDTLILSHNPLLQRLPIYFLPPDSSVKTIDLKHNGLRTLSEKSLPLENLKALDLRENPLVCNCSLLWLGKLLNQQNRSADISDVRCSGPDKLRGVYLSRVTSNELLCVDTLLEVVVGVTVICLSSLLIAGLFYLICRYRRRPQLDKLSGSCGWIEGPLRTIEPWSQDPSAHHPHHVTQQPNLLHPPATTHIISEDYFYHTFPTLRKVPVTEV